MSDTDNTFQIKVNEIVKEIIIAMCTFNMNYKQVLAALNAKAKADSDNKEADTKAGKKAGKEAIQNFRTQILLEINSVKIAIEKLNYNHISAASLLPDLLNNYKKQINDISQNYKSCKPDVETINKNLYEAKLRAEHANDIMSNMIDSNIAGISDDIKDKSDIADISDDIKVKADCAFLDVLKAYIKLNIHEINNIYATAKVKALIHLNASDDAIKDAKNLYSNCSDVMKTASKDVFDKTNNAKKAFKALKEHLINKG